MEIIINTYNLQEIEIIIIKKCIEDFPLETNKEYSLRLGISERTVYRLFKKNNIHIVANKQEKRSIKLLKSLGYNISPPTQT